MPVVVVGTEKNFAALRQRLISGRVSAAVAQDIADAVQAANPDVDLDKLQPGTVLTVPEVRGVATRGDLSLDETVTQGIASLAEGAGTLLNDLAAAAKLVEKESTAERKRLAAALDGNEVQAAARKDKSLVVDLKAAQEAVAADATVATERTAALKQAQKEWLAELEALKALAQ